jgi:hypothetical protein
MRIGELCRSVVLESAEGHWCVMKRLLKLYLVIYAASAMVVTTALGQGSSFPYGWQLDENGPAFIIYGNLAGFSRGTNRVDSISGISGWYYTLFTCVPGDVVLREPPSLSTDDLLRFDGNGVFFFSTLKLNDPNPDMADVPIMPSPINPVILNETGSESGTNGVVYVPGPGMPGYDLSGYFPGLRYNIISDDSISNIPEPSTFALAGIGVVVLLGIARRRK